MEGRVGLAVSRVHDKQSFFFRGRFPCRVAAKPLAREKPVPTLPDMERVEANRAPDIILHLALPALAGSAQNAGECLFCPPLTGVETGPGAHASSCINSRTMLHMLMDFWGHSPERTPTAHCHVAPCFLLVTPS